MNFSYISCFILCNKISVSLSFKKACLKQKFNPFFKRQFFCRLHFIRLLKVLLCKFLLSEFHFHLFSHINLIQTSWKLRKWQFWDGISWRTKEMGESLHSAKCWLDVARIYETMTRQAEAYGTIDNLVNCVPFCPII